MNFVVHAYEETYFAEPRDGWVFDHWGNYCVNAIDNTCSFDIDEATLRQAWGLTAAPLQAVFTKSIEIAPIIEGAEKTQPIIPMLCVYMLLDRQKRSE